MQLRVGKGKIFNPMFILYKIVDDDIFGLTHLSLICPDIARLWFSDSVLQKFCS